MSFIVFSKIPNELQLCAAQFLNLFAIFQSIHHIPSISGSLLIMQYDGSSWNRALPPVESGYFACFLKPTLRAEGTVQ